MQLITMTPEADVQMFLVPSTEKRCVCSTGVYEICTVRCRHTTGTPGAANVVGNIPPVWSLHTDEDYL